MHCMGHTYSVKRRTISNYGRATFLNAHQRCGFEPGTCINTRRVARLTEFYFHLFRKHRVSLSIETDVLPVHIIIALNREGVELQFNQSYRSEVTTVPLGLHYITS
jgi:hypothetical protein